MKKPALREAAPPQVEIVIDLAEEAYARIKAAIIECLLLPGAAISQPMLESRFGLGKAAVRTALTRLQQEELVAAVPRQGYIVSPVTVRDVEDVYTFRLMIEPTAVQLAAPNLDEADFDILERTMSIGYIPGNLDSQRAFIVANRTFHYTVAAKAGNTRLLKAYDKILEDSARIFFLIMGMRDLSGAWVAGHQAIYHALRKGDGDTAARLLQAETQEGLMENANALIRSPAISTLNIASLR